MPLSPDSLLVLQPFVEVVTRPTFSHMRTPVYGTLLASGRRTVIAALRECDAVMSGISPPFNASSIGRCGLLSP